MYSLLLRLVPMRLGRRREMLPEILLGGGEVASMLPLLREWLGGVMGTLLLPFHAAEDREERVGVLGELPYDEDGEEDEAEPAASTIAAACFRAGMGMEEDMFSGGFTGCSSLRCIGFDV